MGENAAGSSPAGENAGALVPRGWESLVGERGLVCGFGDRFATAPARATFVRQVHGRAVLAADLLAEGANTDIEADALTVVRRGRTAAIRTADCVPILMVADDRDWAAVVHAGWRGTVAGIAPAAVEAAHAVGVDAGRLRVALGPSIGPCCYEVGEDLGERFVHAGLSEAVVASDHASPRLDLRAANRALLLGAGVVAERIEVAGPCTRCTIDRYYSYRANSGEGGRQHSWIGWRAGRAGAPA